VSTASASVAALLEMKASASPGLTATGSSQPAIQGRSPAMVSATSASAVRSPVPIAPRECTRGMAPTRSAVSSAYSSLGCTPLPAAASWLSRIASVARTLSSGSAGPVPPAWLRSSCRPCWSAEFGSTTVCRLAPTPVVLP
jgi:hypothetical protein